MRSHIDHMSEIRITISYDNYMRTHMRSLLVSITISYQILYNIFTRVKRLTIIQFCKVIKVDLSFF